MAIIEGYAAIFNDLAYLPKDKYYRGLDVPSGYKVLEYIDARAFDKCDISKCILCKNHDIDGLASVRDKTLDLTIDNYGLHIYADIKEDILLNVRALTDIYRGVLNKMSFKVTGAKHEIIPSKSEKIIYVRMYDVPRLDDVCITNHPIYPNTNVHATRYKSICEPYKIKTYQLFIDAQVKL